MVVAVLRVKERRPRLRFMKFASSVCAEVPLFSSEDESARLSWGIDERSCSRESGTLRRSQNPLGRCATAIETVRKKTSLNLSR